VNNKIKSWLIPFIVLTVFLLSWELASFLGFLRPTRFPAPSKLWMSFLDLTFSGYPADVTIDQHLLKTIERIIIGFLLSVSLSVPLGLLIGGFHVLDRLTSTIIAFCRSIATLSLLPLAIVWFGTGEQAKIFLIAYGCFWVMLSNVIEAVKQVDPVMMKAAKTMDTDGLELFLKVVLPSASPRIFAGMRISLGVGFMVIVGAEMIGTVIGLGSLIMEARTFYRTDITMVGMLILGMMGFLLTTGLAWLERKLMPWQQQEHNRSSV